MRPHTQTSHYIYISYFVFLLVFLFSHNVIGWNLCDNLQFSSKFRKLMHGNREKKNRKKKSKWNDVITYSVELELVHCSGQQSWFGIFWEMLIFCVSNYDDIYQRPNEMQRLSSIRQERKKIYRPMDKPRNWVCLNSFSTRHFYELSYIKSSQRTNRHNRFCRVMNAK